MEGSSRLVPGFPNSTSIRNSSPGWCNAAARKGHAMERIIAARFQTKAEADAVAALMSYIDTDDISIFHNNPPGQHGALATGGDEDEDPSAAGAGKSAATTAVSAGLAAGAIGALGGPVVALAAAAV